MQNLTKNITTFFNFLTKPDNGAKKNVGINGEAKAVAISYESDSEEDEVVQKADNKSASHTTSPKHSEDSPSKETPATNSSNNFSLTANPVEIATTAAAANSLLQQETTLARIQSQAVREKLSPDTSVVVAENVVPTPNSPQSTKNIVAEQNPKKETETQAVKSQTTSDNPASNGSPTVEQAVMTGQQSTAALSSTQISPGNSSNTGGDVEIAKNSIGTNTPEPVTQKSVHEEKLTSNVPTPVAASPENTHATPASVQSTQKITVEQQKPELRFRDIVVINKNVTPNLSISAIAKATQLKLDNMQLEWTVANMDKKYNLQELHQGQNRFTFDPTEFSNAAGNLDAFHASGHAHRNIKPGNMYLYDKQVYLVGHSSVGKVGGFTDFLHSPAYVPESFLAPSTQLTDNLDNSHPINPYKRDHYAFLISMMQAQFNEYPNAGRFSNHEVKLAQFIGTLSCDQTKKTELKNFLTNPANHKLSSKLADYIFQAPQQ